MALYVQVGKTLYKGDSIPDIVTPTLYKYPPIKFKSKRDEAKYNRLVNNVKRVLPYAKQARQILMETGEYLATLPDEKSRKDSGKRHKGAIQTCGEETYFFAG